MSLHWTLHVTILYSFLFLLYFSMEPSLKKSSTESRPSRPFHLAGPSGLLHMGGVPQDGTLYFLLNFFNRSVSYTSSTLLITISLADRPVWLSTLRDMSVYCSLTFSYDLATWQVSKWVTYSALHEAGIRTRTYLYGDNEPNHVLIFIFSPWQYLSPKAPCI